MERLNRLEEEAAARRETSPMYTTHHHSYPSTTVATPLGSAASINDLQQRAQAVTTVLSKKSTVKGMKSSRLDLLPIMMLLLSSLPSKSILSSKTSEMSTSIKCVPHSMKVSKERKERITMRLHRLLSKRPLPIPRHPPWLNTIQQWNGLHSLMSKIHSSTILIRTRHSINSINILPLSIPFTTILCLWDPLSSHMLSRRVDPPSACIVPIFCFFPSYCSTMG